MSDIHPTLEFEDQVRQAMSVPEASPEFLIRLRTELARRPAKKRAAPFTFRPAWALAFVLVLAVLVVSTPSLAKAFGRIIGYVRNVGLVENSSGLRILAGPVSVTRQGITLTLTQVFVQPDHIELVYEVAGLAPENDGTRAADASSNPTAFCGGVDIGAPAISDGDAMLKLPDGTLLERDRTGLYPRNAFAMAPVYKASLPADVKDLTLVLRCIPWARRGAVPENWEVPFGLKSVPEGERVGQPVYTLPQPTAQPTGQPASEAAPSTEGSATPAPLQAKLIMEKVVPTGSGIVFYFSLNVEDPDPSLQSIIPAKVYMIDSQGQTIPLTSGPVHPVEHPVGSLFEYFSTLRPADGPVTLVIENAVAVYAPLYVTPAQSTPAQMSFSFDAGADPRPGQTWQIDQEFDIASHPIRVISARAVTFADIQTPSFIDGSQGYDHGYQFTVQAASAGKISVSIDIRSDSCWLYSGNDFPPADSTVIYTELCRDGYPKGTVTVTIADLSVLLEDTWQATWMP